MEKIVVIGWDGRSNPIYRFYRDIENKVPDHMRPVPSIPEILEQYPGAMYYTSEVVNGEFKRVKLADIAFGCARPLVIY